jgi:peptidoglycan/LPS O-acetylase OafA/YrhL
MLTGEGRKMTETITTGGKGITVDLTWIDMLKGIAIIGVFVDNWNHYMRFDTTPALLYSLAKAFALAAGPFVQVFFILSGFGLTLAYLSGRTNWSWRRWAWRRITKIVIPYTIVVIFSFMLGILGSYLYHSVDMQFSWKALLAYLTFTRNFYPAIWGWNPPLWFMPAMIGLYISFPVLVKILEKWGPWMLLLISVFVTYGTITIAVLAGAPRSHGADVFSFWMMQFSLGMALAYVRGSDPQKLRHLISFKAFLLGVGLFAFSWAVRTYLPLGKAYNDAVTSIGIFLVLLNLCWIGRLQVPATGEILNTLGSKSYLMYLVHYPIMAFLIGPPLRVPTNAIIVLALGGVYIIAIFFLSYSISRPMDEFTSWLYRLFFPPYQRAIAPLTAGEKGVVVDITGEASFRT